MIERLLNYQRTHYKFNYFAYVDDVTTFLMFFIGHDYPNKFIFDAIDKMDLLHNPSHMNIETYRTALTLSSIKITQTYSIN